MTKSAKSKTRKPSAQHDSSKSNEKLLLRLKSNVKAGLGTNCTGCGACECSGCKPSR